MSVTWITPKDPDEVADYAINWVNRLESGETVSTSSWTITSSTEASPTLTEDSNEIDGTRAVIWLSSGTVGVVYNVKNTITTSGGRTYEQTARLVLKEK